jgi:HlyD family secretion protein
MIARVLCAATSLLALFASCGCSNDAAAVGAAEPQVNEPSGDLIRVQLVEPEVITLQRTTTQPVSVAAYHEAEIGAKVSGYVAELNVDIGDEVRKGDVLAVLDVPEMQDEIAEQQAVIRRQKAEEKQATAALALASANVEAAEAALAQAQAEIQQADADLKAEQAEFERIRQLVERKSVEARMEDEGRQRLESAQATRFAVEAAVNSARANVTVAEAKRDAAQADVERAQAETVVSDRQLMRMETMLRYASLTAPFDGVVMARTVDLGDLVSNWQAASGQQVPLFRLGQLNRVRVQVAVPENDSPWMNVGDEVLVRFSSLRGQSYRGTVSRMTRALDESTRTMLAEIDLDNPEDRILPGMYGEATIVLDEQSEAIVLPAGAVRFDAEGKAYVYTVDQAGTVQVVEVTTGVDDGHRIEIVSGLSPTDRVVGGMLDRLTAGQKVAASE